MAATPIHPESQIRDFPHGRVPAALREAQILELAEELFAEVGYRNASMDELARRAGVSKPMIYRLIGGKDEVFRACVGKLAEEMQGEIIGAVAGAETIKDRLRAGVISFFRFVDRHRAAWTMVVTGGTGEVDEAIEQVRVADAVLIAGLFEQYATELGIELDRRMIEAAAHGLNGAGEAIARWAVAHPEIPPEVLGDMLVEFIWPGIERFAAAAGSNSAS